MILWLIFAAMTAAAMLAVLLPLRRRAPARSGSDVAVYRDQLEEGDRDRAAGLVGAGEAEAARVEISRRLIAAAAPPDRAGAPVETRWGRRAAALAGAPMLPLGSAAPSLAPGSPRGPCCSRAARRGFRRSRWPPARSRRRRRPRSRRWSPRSRRISSRIRR